MCFRPPSTWIARDASALHKQRLSNAGRVSILGPPKKPPRRPHKYTASPYGIRQVSHVETATLQACRGGPLDKRCRDLTGHHQAASEELFTHNDLCMAIATSCRQRRTLHLLASSMEMWSYLDSNGIVCGTYIPERKFTPTCIVVFSHHVNRYASSNWRKIR